MQSWLRYTLFPFSLLYAAGVAIRNFCYDVGYFASLSYDTPTLCIGNLSVGGTGKTPMIEYLIRLLAERKIAVLSRGYKRKSKGFVLADAHCTVTDLGDEPFQLYRKFPQITVAVDADRRRGITQLEKRVQPEVILLDDAFQHRRVTPTYALLLTTYDRLFVDDWYLPTGTLRDAKREAKRANMIVVTKCPGVLSEVERQAIIQRLNPKPYQIVLFSYLSYGAIRRGDTGENITLSALQKTKVALVTGIATPEPLVRYLTNKDIEFQHFEYPDHHPFTAQDLKRFQHFAWVLTTEKDYVRLEGRVKSLCYIEVAHQFTAEDKAVLEKCVKGCI